MKIHSNDSMKTLFLATLSTLMALANTSTSAAFTCGGYQEATKSQPLVVEVAPGVQTEVQVEYYDRTAGVSSAVSSEEAPSCFVSLELRLSSFPSSRLATRPSDIAPALRDIAREWGARQCVITIWYDNDTNEEMADHEQCVTGTFGFDGRSSWSASSEGNCWEPDRDEIEI